jgi:predicted anti-sigma-YlaC factor YlaD
MESARAAPASSEKKYRVRKLFGTKSTHRTFNRHGEENMKCRHVRKMISQYMDDELSLDEKKAFDSHIRRCASCREGLEETRSLHLLFASAQRFPAPYGFTTRVLANLDEEEASRARGLFGLRPLFLRAVQVAFALVVMAVGIVSGNLLLAKRVDHIGQTAVQETFSLDLFQAAPPDSIGGIYNTLMRPSHEG